MLGVLTSLTFNGDNSQNITVTVTEDFREEYEALKDGNVKVEITKAHSRRSLNANAYCWVLVGEIAKKLKENRLSELIARYRRSNKT